MVNCLDAIVGHLKAKTPVEKYVCVNYTTNNGCYVYHVQYVSNVFQCAVFKEVHCLLSFR